MYPVVFVLEFVLVVFFIVQVIVPLLTGTPVFPSFRRKARTLESALSEKKQILVEKRLERELEVLDEQLQEEEDVRS